VGKCWQCTNVRPATAAINNRVMKMEKYVVKPDLIFARLFQKRNNNIVKKDNAVNQVKARQISVPAVAVSQKGRVIPSRNRLKGCVGSLFDLV